MNGTAIFRLKEHTDRLFNSAHIYMHEDPLRQGNADRGAKGSGARQQAGIAYVRPIAFYGSEKMGIPAGAKVHVAIAAWPWGSYLGEEGLKKGIRVKTSSLRPPSCECHHVPGQIFRHLRQLDSRQYGGPRRRLRRGAAAGRGRFFVAEGAGENLFIVKDGVIYEPEIASALVGITRGTIIALASELGLKVVAKRLTRDDIYIADEAFFTGTAAEVTPIRELDRRRITAVNSTRLPPVSSRVILRLRRGKEKSHWTGSPRLRRKRCKTKRPRNIPAGNRGERR